MEIRPASRKTAASLISAIRYDLRDPTATQWTDAELLAYLNRGLEMVHHLMVDHRSEMIVSETVSATTTADTETYNLFMDLFDGPWRAVPVSTVLPYSDMTLRGAAETWLALRFQVTGSAAGDTEMVTFFDASDNALGTVWLHENQRFGVEAEGGDLIAGGYWTPDETMWIKIHLHQGAGSAAFISAWQSDDAATWTFIGTSAAATGTAAPSYVRMHFALGSGDFAVDGALEYDTDLMIGDFLAPHRIWIDGYPPMRQAAETDRYDYITADGMTTGVPDRYYIHGNLLGLLPAPNDAYTVNIRYYPQFRAAAAKDYTPHGGVFDLQLGEAVKMMAKHRETYNTGVETALQGMFQARVLEILRMRRPRTYRWSPG